jgi:mannitol/fructose-specific phosphotransferase system IIA component (Ntr-type)
MRLIDLLAEDVIISDLAAPDATGAIGDLLQSLVNSGRLPADDLERVRSIVLEREASMSTGIGHGVAIPHGTVPGLDGVLGALGRSVDGVDFKAIDGQPVNLVVLVLVGENAYRQHIRTLAIVSRLLNSQALREHLLRAGGAAEMLRLIRAEESGELRDHRAL